MVRVRFNALRARRTGSRNGRGVPQRTSRDSRAHYQQFGIVPTVLARATKGRSAARRASGSPGAKGGGLYPGPPEWPARNGERSMSARTLAIERTGDFFRDNQRGRVTARIRLVGQWLERAGFKPGHRVEVIVEQPGTLTLRFPPQPDPTESQAYENQSSTT